MIQIRRVFTHLEEIRHEFGPVADVPLLRGAIGAVLTNPFHPEGMATDLDRALRMEAPERQHRHARLAAVLADHTPSVWASSFLRRLKG